MLSLRPLTNASLLRRPLCLFSTAASDYDVVIVGGGPGGYVAAIKAAQLGLKTACVEGRGSLGGTCLNVGCIPSKALLHSSHLYHEATHTMSTHGITVGSVELDVSKMMENKQKNVSQLTGGIEYLFKKNGVDYVKGWGTFKEGGVVEVSGEDGSSSSVKGKHVVIATGSIPTPIPTLPVDNDAQRIVDSTGALELTSVPKKMAVVGGGVIGLEMGSVWARLGSEVTVLQFTDKICPFLDHEIVKTFTKVLKKQGFKIKHNTKVVGSSVSDSGVTLQLEDSRDASKTSELEADVVLVSAGRKPNTDNLGLDELGVRRAPNGMIEVNDHFETGVPGLYAIGDCVRGPMLAHKAEEEGIACVENIAGLAGHVNYDTIPSVIYTHPEVAAVGKTEEQLVEEGVSFNKGTFPFSANSRAKAVGDSEGLIKVLASKEDDRILGVHIVGPGAGEMIAEATLGLEYGASSEDLARTCHAHPTLSEGLKEACMGAYDKPIHF
jgi:dihydrolipoamide dehydrogenase